MLESFSKIWGIIKGRVITDLNLIGVAVLLWIVAHQGASVLPIVSFFPAALQPILGLILPLGFGIVGQYAIIQTRRLSVSDHTEATHIWTVGEADILELLKSATVKAAIVAALKDADAIGKPLVIGAITAEAPALSPIAEAVIERVEQAAGIANGAEIPAGEVKTPLIVGSPTAPGPDANAAAAI